MARSNGSTHCSIAKRRVMPVLVVFVCPLLCGIEGIIYVRLRHGSYGSCGHEVGPVSCTRRPHLLGGRDCPHEIVRVSARILPRELTENALPRNVCNPTTRHVCSSPPAIARRLARGLARRDGPRVRRLPKPSLRVSYAPRVAAVRRSSQGRNPRRP